MQRALELLKAKEFVSVGTCDFKAKPNVAPKLILKIENNYIYLIDYVIGRTFDNLKINPWISLSFMDLDNLIGYQFNGSVEIIDQGLVYDKMIEELSSRQIELSVNRVIEGVGEGKAHRAFELGLPGQFVIFKVKIEDIVEIGSTGKLNRERVK